jgi:riboflavin biosynthesis pyrimidine reductase
LRAGVILRAHIQGWPGIDLGVVTVEAGPESWASFLEAAAVDELAAALVELNNAARGSP